METVRLDITGLGAQGDGVATHEGRPVFVPFALPGETVEAVLDGSRATDVRVLKAAPGRKEPACSRYGTCGGCTLQHLPEAAYLDFKRALVSDALAANGIRVEVDPVIPCSPRTRRRAVFAASRTPVGVVVGFNERRGGRILDIPDCAVISPDLLAAIPLLSQLAGDLAPVKGHLDIAVTATASGLDAAITNAPRSISADQKLALASATVEGPFARISVNGETILQHRVPAIPAGLAWINPPPGGFLQAVEAAQGQMVELVKQAVGSSRRIADLFCGAGTFAIPLAEGATIHAVEALDAPLESLRNAARHPGLKPVTVERRDLFRRPLTSAELDRYDAVVLDPPRAGAEAQSAQLARSRVRRVAMVSCNAVTFARDIATLAAGGFRLKRVTPVDQFLWSPHIEVVAALSR